MVATLTVEKNVSMDKLCKMIGEMDSCEAEIASHKEAVKALRERIAHLRAEMTEAATKQGELY